MYRGWRLSASIVFLQYFLLKRAKIMFCNMYMSISLFLLKGAFLNPL